MVLFKVICQCHRKLKMRINYSCSKCTRYNINIGSFIVLFEDVIKWHLWGPRLRPRCLQCLHLIDIQCNEWRVQLILPPLICCVMSHVVMQQLTICDMGALLCSVLWRITRSIITYEWVCFILSSAFLCIKVSLKK